MKVSHLEEVAVSALVLKLVKLYGPKATISCSKVHYYLGMEIGFGTDPSTIIV